MEQSSAAAAAAAVTAALECQCAGLPSRSLSLCSAALFVDRMPTITRISLLFTELLPP